MNSDIVSKKALTSTRDNSVIEILDEDISNVELIVEDMDQSRRNKETLEKECLEVNSQVRAENKEHKQTSDAKHISEKNMKEEIVNEDGQVLLEDTINRSTRNKETLEEECPEANIQVTEEKQEQSVDAKHESAQAIDAKHESEKNLKEATVSEENTKGVLDQSLNEEMFKKKDITGSKYPVNESGKIKNKPFVCDVCQFAFENNSDVTDHKVQKNLSSEEMNVTGVESLYSCDQCDFDSIIEYDLKIHKIKNIHNLHTHNKTMENHEGDKANHVKMKPY